MNDDFYDKLYRQLSNIEREPNEGDLDERPLVYLTKRERLILRYCGKVRNKAGLAADADPLKYGDPKRSPLDLHIDGVTYEWVVSKVTDLPWTGMGTSYQYDDDVFGLHVRGTRHSSGRLIIHPSEFIHPDGIWVLVRGDNPYEVTGWIYERDCERPRYRSSNDRPTAYFVPTVRLRPISVLRKKIHEVLSTLPFNGTVIKK
jgi:hypothetical protein